LEPSISLKWFKHAFAPAAVFIDLADQRYFPNGNYKPGEELVFNLVGINDLKEKTTGTVTVKLVDANGKTVTQQQRKIEIPAYQRVNIPAFLNLPQQNGGYLILAEFVKDGLAEVIKSRRYIKVGEVGKTGFCEIEP
jgi:hypothetical protein